MTDDEHQLIRQFVEHRSETAFATLVQRHLNLVYSAALRQVTAAHTAEDIVQSVFLDLSRKAHRLKPDTVLSAWLYQVTRRRAIDAIRREFRRQRRERAAMQHYPAHEPDENWTLLAPALDEAMDTLNDLDRAAIIMRYFENKTLRDVGAAIACSDDAAQKRISRAIERMRTFFGRRGIRVSASALVAAISTNAIQAAPSTVLASATACYIAAPAASVKILALPALQAAVASILVIGAIGFSWSKQHEANILRRSITQLQVHVDNLKKDLAARRQQESTAREEAVSRNTDLIELARLRAEVAQLRQGISRKAATPSAVVPVVSQPPVLVSLIITNLAPVALTDDDIRAFIQTRVGEPVERTTIDRDVRKLYGSGFFSSIRVVQDSNDVGIVLTYVVREKEAQPAAIAPESESTLVENLALATPEQSLQTLVSMSQSARTNTLAEMIGWRKEQDDTASDELASQIARAQAASFIKTFGSLSASQIIEQSLVAPDTARLRVQFEEKNGRTHIGDIYMQFQDNRWKPAVNLSRRPGGNTISAKFFYPASEPVRPK